MKTTNRKCREFVQSLKPFQASNLSGFITGDFYVVYSYAWYPLFAYSFKLNKWFENEERYSVSTSKQRGQRHPHQPTELLSHDQLKCLISERVA